MTSVTTDEGVGRGLPVVALATGFAAVSGYAVLVLAANRLGAAHYEDFAVFWAAFSALTTTLSGIAVETTRSISAEDPAAGPNSGTRPAIWGAVIGGGALLLLALTSPWWIDIVAPEAPGLAIALLCVGTFSIAMQAVLIGALSGTRHWRLYATVLAVDAALRLLVAVIAAATGEYQRGFLLATVSGCVTWALMLVVSHTSRTAFRRRVREPGTLFVSKALGAMVAAAAMALLLVGFPILIKAAFPGAPSATVGVLILAVTLTRAPILIPFTFFNTAIVVHFVGRRPHVRTAAVLPLAVTLAVTLVLAGIAWLIGPAVLAAMGPGFDIAGWVLAGLTLGAGCTACLFISGPVVLALDRHRVYAAGWWTAVVISVAVLFLMPGEPAARTIVSLIVGPAAGVTTHLAFARSAVG